MFEKFAKIPGAIEVFSATEEARFGTENVANFADMKTLLLNDTFAQEYPVTCENIDPDYRLKLTSALAMFQDTVASYMTTKHFGAYDVLPMNLIWVVPEHNVEFTEDMPILRDKVISEIRVGEITPVRIYFDFKLYVKGKEPFATGEGVWTLVDLESKRSVCVSDHLPVMAEGEAIKHKKLIIPSLTDIVKEAVYQTTFRDMDFNRHVGNRSYIDIALQFAPAEFMDTHYLKSLGIKFIRQTYIGDILTTRYAAVPDVPNAYLVSMFNREGEEACRMEMVFGEISKHLDLAAVVSRD